ncbi:MAG: nucleotidyltransferase [Anaerotignaceae bacterium]
MNTAGIVAEYNPFHNGHKYHIEETMRITGCDDIIVALSGNFVQRGEPAIVDKWTRTRSALLNGASIVIELPVLFSTAGAQYFAHSAVKLLNDTGIVDFLSFGSEMGSLSQLKETAKILLNESTQLSTAIKNNLENGLTYAVARQTALEEITEKSHSFISSSNNILAIEYLKALYDLNSSIMPVTVKRIGEGYNSTNTASAYPSASALRKAVANGDMEILASAMPKNAQQMFTHTVQNGSAPIYLNSFSTQLNYCLRSKSPKELSKILDINEGLENRILKSLATCYSINDILDFVKTKRYSHTTLQRGLLHILLDIETNTIKQYQQNGYCPYIRVLGFRKDRQHLLKSLIEKASIPVITNVKRDENNLDENGKHLFNLEKKATDLYYMASPSQKHRNVNKEYTTPMVIV